MSAKRVAIVGGGLSGLACAWRLHELQKEHGEPLEITVLDSGPRLGGNIETQILDGFLLEKGPDAFLSETPEGVDLARRLGIASELMDTQKGNRKSFVVKDGKLTELPEGFYLVAPADFFSFFMSGLFSFKGKLRALSELFVPKSPSDGDESVASFIRRRFGEEVLERVGEPMVAGIHSGDPELLSISKVVPRLKEMEDRYGSVIRGLLKEHRGQNTQPARGPRYGLFLSFRLGMQTLTDALVSALKEAAFRLHSNIQEITWDLPRSCWLLRDQNGRSAWADAVCWAGFSSNASGVLKTQAPSLSAKLGSIKAHSVATLNFAYARQDVGHPLDGFGFVVPRIEGRSLMACTFSSQKFSNRSPEGFVLLRAFTGGAFREPYLELSDAALIQKVREDLEKLLSIRGSPLFAVLKRHRNSMPQCTVGHARFLREVEEELRKLPGLFLTGAVYGGTGIPACLRDAQRQAERLFAYLTRRTDPMESGSCVKR